MPHHRKKGKIVTNELVESGLKHVQSAWKVLHSIHRPCCSTPRRLNPLLHSAIPALHGKGSTDGQSDYVPYVPYALPELQNHNTICCICAPYSSPTRLPFIIYSKQNFTVETFPWKLGAHRSSSQYSPMSYLTFFNVIPGNVAKASLATYCRE